MLLPVVAYGIMFFICKHYPVDERVEANIPISEMLKEFGGLGAFLAITFLFYEVANQLGLSKNWPGNHLLVSVGVGAVGGIIFGAVLKSLGQILFFILCVIMIPLATAELATDGWIQTLMRPVLSVEFNIHSGWAIVASASIMMTLRFFAGIPLKYLSPPALLFVSSCFSIVGLYMLSSATGSMIFIAFVFYGIGQTFYWPTVLGFVSERFPKGGAMTLNTVSAMGLLTVGIFGFPFLGAVKDSFDAKAVAAHAPALYSKYEIADKKFFGVSYNSIKANEVLADESLTDETKISLKTEIDKSARSTIKVAAVLPGTMAVAFLLIILWFKTQGGYRQIHLDTEGRSEPGGDNAGKEEEST